MIEACPNLNDPEVAREFNEIKEATSEKTAYNIWSLNNGYSIDKAPNGAKSILFESLLTECNGDKAAAIRAKAALYGNRFREWFGDWLQEDKTNVSKAVDENDEPLIVYHHTDNSNLTEFSTDFENYFTKDGGTKEAIFFDENKTGTLGRKYDIPVFLNIKDLNEYNETKQQLHDRGTTYRDVVNQSAAKNNRDGGVHMKDFDDNKMEHQSIWIVHNSNQIKSATGNIETEKPDTGFSTTDNNIYHLETDYIDTPDITNSDLFGFKLGEDHTIEEFANTFDLSNDFTWFPKLLDLTKQFGVKIRFENPQRAGIAGEF